MIPIQTKENHLYHVGKFDDEFALLVLLAALVCVLVFPTFY